MWQGDNLRGLCGGEGAKPMSAKAQACKHHGDLASRHGVTLAGLQRRCRCPELCPKAPCPG